MQMLIMVCVSMNDGGTAFFLNDKEMVHAVEFVRSAFMYVRGVNGRSNYLPTLATYVGLTQFMIGKKANCS